MTLTQHLLIISIFPFSFLVLLIYLWRSQSQHPIARKRWAITLLFAALWSSAILRFHGGQAFTAELIYGWGVLSNYLLSLTALGLLMATASYLNIPRQQQIAAGSVTTILIGVALLLDIHLWGHYLGNLWLMGQPIDQFDLWIAVWITSWWVAAFTALIMTLQKNASAPNSLYRNQIHYWLIVVLLFLLGGSIASVQQHNRPIWQEIGVLLILPAAIVGTISIARSQMPDLQLTLRRLLNRLSGTLIIFGLTWVVLSFLTQRLANLPPELSHNLVLVLAAFLFAGLFMVVYRVVNQLTRRIFLPALTRRDVVLTDYANAVGNLPEPAQLGRLLLRRIESNLTTTDGFCFLAEEGPGGQLMLRPLTTASSQIAGPQAASFSADSPFVTYLRQSHMPLVQYDVDNLAQFTAMPEVERAILAQWDKFLYLPLRAGDSLIGLVALGAKESGEAYDLADFGWLVALADHISPILAQARNLANLHQINDYVFAQNQALARHQQHLLALLSLQREFIRLVSPDLRRPLLNLEQQLKALEAKTADDPTVPLKNASQHLNELLLPLDALINTASRIQKRDAFQFEPIHLDAVIRSVLRNLRTMAEARRIRIEYDIVGSIPDIHGDQAQLREAIHNLLHNAIKFNKIGGHIMINCHVDGSELCLRIVDSGVGIRSDRLPHIWSGLDQPRTNNGDHNQRSGGLGLKLTQFIVAAHGGRIEAQSTYGSGSIFTIYLPLVLVE
jgi:signal transduction histidine kinase